MVCGIEYMVYSMFYILLEVQGCYNQASNIWVLGTVVAWLELAWTLQVGKEEVGSR